MIGYLLCPLLMLVLTATASANVEGLGLPGEQLGLIWTIPFAGILSSLAFFPMISPAFWHSHYGKISAFWAFVTLASITYSFGWDTALYETLHTYLLEYIPFILVAGTLFVVSGGIQLQFSSAGKPMANTLFLAFGTFIASWIGTTGAAMLFVRPLLNMNKWREKRTHLMIFFIFLVCNLGGSLTALGDPPLFLGFLKGVPFFWPMEHLIMPLLVMAIPLLCIFYVIDLWYFKHEDLSKKPRSDDLKFVIKGQSNILLLMCVMVAVIISGSWKPGVTYNVFHVPVELQNIFRDVAFIVITIISLKITHRKIREYNMFNWEPILEVSKLFAGIFITAMPVIMILKAGTDGALAPLVELVNHDGQPVNSMYFWLTGTLSAFLDNAPTYLVFFFMAGGDANVLTTTMAPTLTAISAGAVFMGALTYIGNAPNFLVKSIAESNNVSMPSFFGYTFIATAALLPLLIIVSWILF